MTSNSIRQMTKAALMTALTAVGAYLIIPIGPVPITMQSGVALSAGALLGSRWGAISQVVYLIMGLVGVPIFAGGRSGPGVVLLPTFGFLIGFIAAAFVVGWYLERCQSWSLKHVITGMVAGLLILYILGIFYLYINFNFILGQALTFSGALSFGLIPFIPFDIAKIALAAAVVMALKKRQLWNYSFV